MLVSEFICAARARLWDVPKKLVPQDFLFLEFLNSGLCDHHKNRPELYVAPKIVKLVPGSYQKPECCDTVTKVDVLTDESGETVLATLRTATQILASNLFASRLAASCSEDGGIPLPSTVVISSMIPGSFEVSPPVAKGQEVYARVWCVSAPGAVTSVEDEVNLSCGNYEDIMRFVTGNVLMTIPGSPEENARGAALMELYLNIQGVQRRIQKEIYKGDK